MLTDTRVRSAKPTQRPQKLTDARGLYLLVAPSGGKYWRYDYSFNGRRKTLAFGVYPDVGLGKARERHHEARQQLAEGVDPGEVVQSYKQDFEGVARAWLAHWRTGRSDRYVGYVIARLESDVFPQIGSRPISELATSEFRDLARNIEPDGSFSNAARSCATP
jgi:hypothetical protein